LWEKENDERLKKITQVRVYANGQQQVPARLMSVSAGERMKEFKAELTLSRARENLIAVKLPDATLQQEAASRRECLVDCGKPEGEPERGRRAHLLIVSTGGESEKSVRDRLYRALQATPVSGTDDRFTLPGFSGGGRLYGPLVSSDISAQQVYYQLSRIKSEIDLRVAAGRSMTWRWSIIRAMKRRFARPFLPDRSGAGERRSALVGDPLRRPGRLLR